MRRTVVHFTDSKEFGGAERALVQLITGLDRARWHPVLYFHPSGPEIPWWIRDVAESGIEVVEVPPLDRRRNAANWPQFVWQLRRSTPDIFHAHLTWPLACTEAILLARFARVPVVTATMQLFWDLPYNAFMRLKRRLVSAAVDRYIAVSDENADRMRSTFGLRPGMIQTIPNAVDLSHFDTSGGPRSEDGSDEGRPVVLTIARLAEQKGIRYLLDAASSVPEADFLIAGDGPDRQALESRAHQLGLAERVRFLGFRDDIPGLLAACDVFVLPSLYEGFPLSILEALGVGKPVVASAVGGIPEVIQDGRTGLLVPAGDPGALADAIRRILNDSADARAMARAGQELVRENYSVEAMVRTVSTLYDELLAEARA